MKTSVRGLATRFTALVLSCSLVSVAAASQEWYQSYEEALAAAKREGKPIFADFSTTWCHNCKQLERETLSDPNIEARLDNFIKVHIDGDQRADMVQRYGVDAYPTLVTMDPAGRMVDKSVGFVKPPQLAGTLDSQMQTLAPVLQQMHPAKAPETAKTESSSKVNNSKEFAEGKQVATTKLSESNSSKKLSDKTLASQPATDARMQLFHGKADPRAAELKANEGISKPILDSAALAQAPSVKSGSSGAPLSKAEQRFQAQQALKSQHTSTAPARSFTTAKADISSSREIRPLLNTARNGAPGGGAVRGESDELVISQAEPRKTPASAVTQETPAGDEELPRPLLNAGSRGGASAASGKGSVVPASTSKSTSKQASESAAAQETTAKATATEASGKTGEQAIEEDDGMSTIRKLQKSGKAAPKGTQAARTEEAAKKPTAKTDSTMAKSSPKESAAKETVAATSSAEKTEPVAAGESTESPAKSAEVSAEDIERWSKDADSKLLSGRKKEARAMYQKVYEKDPTNKYGRSDMAFIKMVSLMVDQDDDALRQKALNKIKEFEALFPNSEHKDYYTLIRATLAADLGDTNAAHRLLETFPERFPDSKYQKLAHDTWKSLPPVTKETAKATPKESSSSSKKSSDKKKKAED